MRVARIYSPECLEHCPVLKSCASEFILRKNLYDPDTKLEDIIEKHISDGTLPEICLNGPIVKGRGWLSSVANWDHEAFDTNNTIGARGDSVSVRCSRQGSNWFK